MSARDLPNFTELEATVSRSFVHQAHFTPARFKFWTYPTAEICQPVVQKRPNCRAHKSINLAVPAISSTTNLQLLCGYTDRYTSPVFIIDKDTWTSSGAFEVSCFDPDFEVDVDSGEKKIIYRRGTGMEFQVKCVKSFVWKPLGVFRQLNTKLRPSLFEEAADLFTDLLTLE